MNEIMGMKQRVLTSFSLFHESDKNVAKHTLECTIAVGFRHELHPQMPDWDMTTDITFLMAHDTRRVIASLDPCVLDTRFNMECGEI